MMTQRFDRFKDAPWYQQGINPPVMVGGAGGIGSWLVIALTRAGFQCVVFDHDTLEEINMAGQAYTYPSIGKPKVEAIADIVRLLCDDEIIPMNQKMDETTITHKIFFSAFDKMKPRKNCFESWLRIYRGEPDAIFIDGRLTAEQITIYCVRANDEDGIYEYQTEHLPADSEIPDESCTMKQTSHNAMQIGGKITELFVNWYSAITGKDDSRYTPFFYEHFCPLGITKERQYAKPRPQVEEIPIIPPSVVIIPDTELPF